MRPHRKRAVNDKEMFQDLRREHGISPENGCKWKQRFIEYQLSGAVFPAVGFRRGGIDKEAAAPAVVATAVAARATWSEGGGGGAESAAASHPAWTAVRWWALGGGDEAHGTRVEHSRLRAAGKAEGGRTVKA